MPDNRIQALVDLGIGGQPEDFSLDARRTIDSISDEEFNSILTIRKQFMPVGSSEGQDDQCLGFIT